MEVNKKVNLQVYVFILFLLFAGLFVFHYREIKTNEWVAIFTFAGVAALFEVQRILLSSHEEYLSLAGPLFLTVSIMYGVLPVFYVIVFFTALLIYYRPVKWFPITFNGIQYGISTYFALQTYIYFDGLTGNFQLEHPVPYLFYMLAYFLTNILLVALYSSIDSNLRLREIIPRFFEKQALLIYFTLMLFGVVMTIVLQAVGLDGVIILSIALWFVGISYRGYYNMYEHFRSLATKDELTGLYNHRFFQETVDVFLAKDQQISLLLMDLDYFKVYNDMYGHLEGDKLLREMSGLISEQVPEGGIVCRYGGEEFAVLLPGMPESEALIVAEKIRETVAGHTFTGMEHMPQKRITISVGVSSFPDMAKSKENLIMLADEALYKVKYTSRNNVQLYSSVIDELKSGFQFGMAERELVQTIKTFLAIINSKDRYTYGHTERDVEYAIALAKKLGLPEEEIRYIQYGALLHDIGKIEIPIEILNKRGGLTNNEWEIMKMHVVWGEDIVRPIKDLAPCLPIIRHHHERFDGTGYPDQLAGEEIPFAARILTIVDSFDAMTTNRPYQKTKTVEEAIEELRRCAGSQFDPNLVGPFIEVLTKLRPAQELKKAE